MRKPWILLLAMVFAITGCNAKTPEHNTENVNKGEITKKANTMGAIHLTKDEFLKKVVNYETNSTEWKYLGDKPCIVDFYADWCGPCKSVAPILEELAKEYDGQIYVYKINTDKEQAIAEAFGIRSIPTLFFVPMEGKPQTSVGALSKVDLVKAINDILLAKK
jgi:thioredoxin